jgi:hypothetical protein
MKPSDCIRVLKLKFTADETCTLKYLRVETWTSALASSSIYAAHHEHFRQSKISTCVHLKQDVLKPELIKATVLA